MNERQAVYTNDFGVIDYDDFGIQPKNTFVVGYSDADYIVDGTADNVQIQAALDAAVAVGGGKVILKQGVYTITTAIIPRNNVILEGVNKTSVTLQKTTGSDWMVLNLVGAITNFTARNITFDVLNTVSGSALQLRDATSCRIENCHFKNGTNNGWFLFLGSEPSDTSTFIGENNKIIDCSFDNHSGSLEMLLVFNQRNLEIVRPVFTNNLSGPTFGLWQKCYQTKIISPYFRDCSSTSLYYSITCDDIIIENPVFINSQNPIQGANVSDNGQFGETFCRNIKIINPILIGGASTITSTGIQLGAVVGAEIINPYITEYEIGIVADNGNTPANFASRKISITNPHIFNNNASNINHTIHPGILLSTSANHDWETRISGGNIYDSQISKTQRFPIAFAGASVVHSGVEIVGTKLSADTANSGKSIVINDGGSLGATTVIRDCLDVTDTGVATTDDNIINNNLIYQKDGKVKLGANTIPTVGTALQIGDGGATEYLQFGDSAKIRGLVGHLESRPIFTGKQFRIQDTTGTTTAFIDFDNGHIVSSKLGGGLQIKEGANARMGIATLVAGTVTVANTSVTANSRIFLTSQSDGGTTGALRVSTRVNGTSFTITSLSNTDTSVVAYHIIEPSA